MQKNKSKIITALLLAVMTLALFPLAAQASTGNIYINTTSPGPSAVGQQVAAGGTVDLHFGGVTWSGAQFYLMMSTDGFSQVSTGDSRYSPLFDVTNLTSTATSTYTYMGQSWTVGNGHIIGPIQMNLAGGNYWIKAFDGATTSVAVTDTFITITPNFFVLPNSGAANTPVTLSGFAFKPNALVNISYTNPVTLEIIPIATLISANASGIFEYIMNVPDLRTAIAAGDNPIVTNTIIFTAIDNATGISYPTLLGFTQGARGLLQVKRTGPAPSEYLPSAGNMFGNGTDFTATGAFPLAGVGVNRNIIIAGNSFFPGNMSVRWDNSAVLGTAAVNATGFFNTTITVPITPIGPHNITMVDANGQVFVIFVTVVPSITLSPASGRQGTTVTVTGYGFPASTATNVVNASLSWPGLTAYIGSAITDATGSFTATFVAPQSVGGPVIITAFNNASGTFDSTATATFTVTAGFAVTPNSFANNGTLIVVASGSGFSPADYYTVNIDNQQLAVDPQLGAQATSLRPNATGFLSVAFVGTGFAPGEHVVSVYDWGAFADGSVVPTAWATFTVLPTGDPTIDAINKLNTTIAGQLTAITGSIATLTTSVGQVQTSVSSLGATISSVNSGIATITSNVGSISTQLSNLNAAIVAVQGEFATVTTSLGTITTSLASLDAKVTSIQGSVATVQTAVGTLQGTVTAINGDVATIKTGVGTLQTSVGNVQTDLTSTKDNTSGMSMLIYVAIAFALIAAIAAVASILLMRKKIAS